ncbi:hypothetical protein B0T17DRAFT_124732 [Bombardia bombarda]|uniref:Uncharacterized protein n=1 Tax=Bombardia bombarda TaxID=252184 RepID=A0AA39W3Y1_9PEZI|nr:hypothetical protein B0T17DRAFT_124732 [Bombardia bombarda]
MAELYEAVCARLDALDRTLARPATTSTISNQVTSMSNQVMKILSRSFIYPIFILSPNLTPLILRRILIVRPIPILFMNLHNAARCLARLLRVRFLIVLLFLISLILFVCRRVGNTFRVKLGPLFVAPEAKAKAGDA